MASGPPKMGRVRSIDVHAHVIILPGEMEEKCKSLMPRVSRNEAGNKVFTVRDKSFKGPDQLYEPELRVRDMDRTGVEVQVLSIMPPLIFYDLDRGLGVTYSQIQNDSLAEFVKAYPRRFVGLATVPLQHPRTAAAELERAMKDLGMKGAQILSDVNEKNLDWPELWPFYEKAQELGAFILCHPTVFPVKERMKKYHLQNLVGHPFDTTLAIASLIFGGVLEDFPRLKVCFVHGGGFAPYQRGRFEHGFEVRTECREVISRPPGDYFQLLYFDTVTHDVPALEYLIHAVGSDKVLLGSDYPADMADSNPVATLGRLASIPNADKEMILGKNAAQLLGIDT